MVQVASPDELYDLPFALAYAKLTWFVWVPLDASHRKWKKVNSDATVSQEGRGCVLSVSGDFSLAQIEDELSFWFNPTQLLLEKEDIASLLYLKYPLRLPRANRSDIEIMFVAAVLSPLVSWKINARWVKALYSIMGTDIRKIADSDPSELSAKVTSYDKSARGMGYHSRVLVRAMQDVVDREGGFGEFFRMNSLEARKALLGIYGVGPKISMFLVQVTHGDLNAPCVDRHVFRNGIRAGMIPLDCVPYVPASCRKFIDDCGRCPSAKRCAASYLMRWPASSILSSLLFYWNGAFEQLIS
jgi:endonuclease III